MTRHFGRNLVAAMDLRGLTNAALARKMEIGERQITRWRSSTTAPRLENIVAIADALDVSVDALLGRAPLPTREAGEGGGGADQDARAAARAAAAQVVEEAARGSAERAPESSPAPVTRPGARRRGTA
ncbi:MAG: helix-turn-helix transcriptional regulator [Actinomycetota bacterium]